MATHYIGSKRSSKVSAIHFCCKVSMLICQLSAWKVDAGRVGRCLTCTFLWHTNFDLIKDIFRSNWNMLNEYWEMLKPQVCLTWKKAFNKKGTFFKNLLSCEWGVLKPPCGSRTLQYSYAFLLKNILITHFWMPLLKPKPWWTFREDILMQACLMDCCLFPPSQPFYCPCLCGPFESIFISSLAVMPGRVWTVLFHI